MCENSSKANQNSLSLWSCLMRSISMKSQNRDKPNASANKTVNPAAGSIGELLPIKPLFRAWVMSDNMVLLLVWLSCVIIILQGSIAQSIFVMAWPRLRVYWQWELPLSNPLNLLCFFFINILTNKSLSNFPPSFFSIYTLTFSKGLLTQPLADKGAGGTPGPHASNLKPRATLCNFFNRPVRRSFTRSLEHAQRSYF